MEQLDNLQRSVGTVGVGTRADEPAPGYVATEGCYLLDLHGRCTYIDRATGALLGYRAEELVGELMHARIHHHRYDGAPYPADECPVQRTVRTGLGCDLVEEVYWRSDNTPLPVRCTASPIIEDGLLTGVAVTVVDVQRRREADVRQAYLAAIVESSDDAIIGTALDGTVVSWNGGAERLYGYAAAEVEGRSLALVSPPGRDDELPALLARVALGEHIDHFETTRVRKDGRYISVSVSLSPVRDPVGRAISVAAVARDVTERRRVMTELTLARRRLAESREAEQVRLAREIHDGPLQELYGARYRLAALAEALPAGPGRADLAAVQDLLEAAGTTLRAICGELRPPTLAPFGLAAAIRSHVEGLRQTRQIPAIELDLMPDAQALPGAIRLAFFRIYQEVMRNALRHAAARRVAVRLAWDVEQIELEVRDDGRGFVAPSSWAALARDGHLGLLGVSERAADIGASLAVRTAPGQGTAVRVTASWAAEGELAGAHPVPAPGR